MSFSFLLFLRPLGASANPYPKTLLPPELHLTLILLISGALTLTKTKSSENANNDHYKQRTGNQCK
jgi:hypothetical protein